MLNPKKFNLTRLHLSVIICLLIAPGKIVLAQQSGDSTATQKTERAERAEGRAERESRRAQRAEREERSERHRFHNDDFPDLGALDIQLRGLEDQLKGLDANLAQLSELQALSGLQELAGSLQEMAALHELQNLGNLQELSGLEQMGSLEQLSDLSQMGDLAELESLAALAAYGDLFVGRENQDPLTDEENLKLQALQSLIDTQEEGSFEATQKAFTSAKSVAMRLAVLSGIAQFDTRESIDLLGQIAREDADLTVRKHAVRLLGNSSNKHAVEVLGHLLQEMH